MTRADDTILEFLRNQGNREIVANPAVIAANIDYTGSTVRKRVRVLEEEGLIEYHNQVKSLYGITEIGREYLDGQIDADVLEN